MNKAPIKPKKPLRPKKPRKPTRPRETYMVEVDIVDLGRKKRFTLPELIAQIPKGVSLGQCFIYNSDHYDYSPYLAYVREETNPRFNSEIKRYTKALEKYELKMAEYKNKLLQFKADREEYNLWEMGQEKVRIERKLRILNKNLKRNF